MAAVSPVPVTPRPVVAPIWTAGARAESAVTHKAVAAMAAEAVTAGPGRGRFDAHCEGAKGREGSDADGRELLEYGQSPYRPFAEPGTNPVLEDVCEESGAAARCAKPLEPESRECAANERAGA
jgi:hypothetical protein